MIVSQSDYERWQTMYGKKDGTAGEPVAASKTESSTQASGQTFTLEKSEAQERGSLFATSERPKTFLEEAFERVLLQRLGIDQGKMDELKEEIEKTETAIEALDNEKPHTESQKKELTDLHDKLEKLKEALEELVKQANERANENEISGQQNGKNFANQYLTISSLT